MRFPRKKSNELRARDKRPYTPTCARSFSFSWQLLLCFDLSCKPLEMLKELSRSDAGEYNPSAHYSCEPSGGCFQSAHHFGHLRTLRLRCRVQQPRLLLRMRYLNCLFDDALKRGLWRYGRVSPCMGHRAIFKNISAAGRLRYLWASVDQTDRANRIDVVAAEFHRTLPQCGRAHELEESLRSGQEIVALPQNQIKLLPRDRQKVQAHCQGNGACDDTAVGPVRAHRLCDIHSGRANRGHQGEIIRRDVSARQQREQQQLRASAGRPLR